MDNDQEFLAEKNFLERVSFRNKNINIRTPEGLFIYTLSENFDLLMTPLNLTDIDKYNLINLSNTIPNIKYKNPAALIYAYKVVQDGRISQTKLNLISTKLEFGITIPDVLRYCRLILKL